MPPQMARKVKQKAADQRTSVNKAVILLLAEGLGMASKKRRRHKDLDSLAGRWKAREAGQFDKALAAQRAIDRDLWR